jgi:hypothetical protein
MIYGLAFPPYAPTGRCKLEFDAVTWPHSPGASPQRLPIAPCATRSRRRQKATTPLHLSEARHHDIEMMRLVQKEELYPEG